MTSIQLLSDEMILLQSEMVTDMDKRETCELTLTDKRLIAVKKRGFFTKTIETNSFDLNQISVLAGKLRVDCIRDNGIYILRIGLKDQIKQYAFADNSKKTVNEWVNTIYKVLTGQESAETNDTPDPILAGVSYIAGALKGTVDTFKKSFGNAIQQTIEQVSFKCPYCGNEHVAS